MVTARDLAAEAQAMSGMWNDVHIFRTLNYLFTVSLVPQVSERVAKEDQVSREGSAPDSRGTGADHQVEARCKYSLDTFHFATWIK